MYFNISVLLLSDIKKKKKFVSMTIKRTNNIVVILFIEKYLSVVVF